MRATDQQQSIWQFTQTMMVICPRCAAPAWSRPLTDAAHEKAEPGIFAARRVTCSRCAFAKDWRGRITFAVSIASPVTEGYFGLPLYLQTACCGDTLWAYNTDHLQALSEWLTANLRQRQSDPQTGWANRSYFSRLPKWLKSAKNRDAVASALMKLQALSEALPRRET